MQPGAEYGAHQCTGRYAFSRWCHAGAAKVVQHCLARGVQSTLSACHTGTGRQVQRLQIQREQFPAVTWAALLYFLHDQVAHVAQQHAVHGIEAVFLAIRHTPAPVKQVLSTVQRDLLTCCMVWLAQWQTRHDLKQQHSICIPAAQPGRRKLVHACKRLGMQLAC